MDYKTKIAELEKQHHKLNVEIDNMEKNHPGVDTLRVAASKKERLALRDEISRLTRLEWEDKHERVDFDDDR